MRSDRAVRACLKTKSCIRSICRGTRDSLLPVRCLFISLCLPLDFRYSQSKAQFSPQLSSTALSMCPFWTATTSLLLLQCWMLHPLDVKNNFPQTASAGAPYTQQWTRACKISSFSPQPSNNSRINTILNLLHLKVGHFPQISI